MSQRLSEDERRKVRLAGQIARGTRYFLYFVLVALAILLAAGLYIHYSGG